MNPAAYSGREGHVGTIPTPCEACTPASPEGLHRRDVFGTVSGPSPPGRGPGPTPVPLRRARMNAIGLARRSLDPGPQRPAISLSRRMPSTAPRLAAGRGRVRRARPRPLASPGNDRRENPPYRGSVPPIGALSQFGSWSHTNVIHRRVIRRPFWLPVLMRAVSGTLHTTVSAIRPRST
jgi:hypothetical protein